MYEPPEADAEGEGRLHEAPEQEGLQGASLPAVSRTRPLVSLASALNWMSRPGSPRNSRDMLERRMFGVPSTEQPSATTTWCMPGVFERRSRGRLCWRPHRGWGHHGELHLETSIGHPALPLASAVRAPLCPIIYAT